jgi:predicted TIM-barrel fold metal-dependent hydrolase
MVIDVHHHLVSEPGYVDTLLRRMDDLNIEKAGLIAMGTLFEQLFVTTEHTCGPSYEEDVLDIIRRHPDRFFGYVYIRLGYDGEEKVRKWGELGFRGVKFHIPKENYGHYDYLPIYEAAQELDMICLFHTGLFYMPSMKGERVSAERTRPVHVEAVVNELPDLKVILAHMGGVWAEEACGLARIYSNVHADMSGRLDGWRKSKSTDWFKEMLYWPSAPDKILFGSDVHAMELAETLSDQIGKIRAIGWSHDAEQKFCSENARRLFRLSA